MEGGDFPAAITAFDLAIARAGPESARAARVLGWRGTALCCAGRVDEGLVALAHAVAAQDRLLGPDDACTRATVELRREWSAA